MYLLDGERGGALSLDHGSCGVSSVTRPSYANRLEPTKPAGMEPTKPAGIEHNVTKKRATRGGRDPAARSLGSAASANWVSDSDPLGTGAPMQKCVESAHPVHGDRCRCVW